MKNLSRYQVVHHTKDEHLHCFSYTYWCDFYEVIDTDGTVIGKVCEENGDVRFKGSFFSAEDEANIGLHIELLEVHNDRICIYIPYTEEFVDIHERRNYPQLKEEYTEVKEDE